MHIMVQLIYIRKSPVAYGAGLKFLILTILFE